MDNGLSKSAGEWINLNLGPTQSIELFGDVIVSADCELNTIITATIELEGGSDELGRPITKSLSAALLVAERRNVVLQEISNPEEELKPKESQIFWINLTSSSTKSEIFEIESIVPEGWGMVCDGYTVHLEATKIELEPGHLIPQSHDMRCEVIRESGDLSGEYRVFVNGSDDRINYQVNSELSWSQPTADEGFSAMQIGTVSGLALFAIIGLILFLKRDDIDEENMYEEDYPDRR